MSEQANYANPAEARCSRNKSIARDYAAGIDIEDIAQRAGLTVSTARSIVCILGARQPRFARKQHSESVLKSRDDRICAQYLSGESLEIVGAAFGITRERVRQILVREGHEERHNGFNTPRRAAWRERQTVAQDGRQARKERMAAERAHVRDLYNGGATYDAIAEQLNKSKSWVQNTVWCTGGPSRYSNAGKRRNNLTEDQRQTIARRYPNENVQALALEYGVCPDHVRNIARARGGHR